MSISNKDKFTDFSQTPPAEFTASTLTALPHASSPTSLRSASASRMPETASLGSPASRHPESQNPSLGSPASRHPDPAGRIKAVLFDYDGTVGDTNQLVIDSWQHTFMTIRGRRTDDELLYHTFGEPLRETMARFFPEHDLEDALRIYRDWQAAQDQNRWYLFPGMRQLIGELRRRGYRMGIVTSRTRDSLERALVYLGMEDTFSAIVTCDDTTVHKPEPEPALIGLEKLDVRPDQALFVGDTHYDMGCAHNAGIEAVLVGWSRSMRPEDKVGIYRPDYEIKNAGELLEILEKC